MASAVDLVGAGRGGGLAHDGAHRSPHLGGVKLHPARLRLVEVVLAKRLAQHVAFVIESDGLAAGNADVDAK